MDLESILLADDVVESINQNIDYLVQIIPEIKSMFNFPHNNPNHHLDVWNHTLLALSLSEKDYDTRLCLLLHDIGKPHSYQEDEVRQCRHFWNHPKKSEEISRVILKRLGYNDDYINYICYLILHHDDPITDEQLDNNYELSLKLFGIQKCDALAHHPDRLEKRKRYIEETKNKILMKKG